MNLQPGELRKLMAARSAAEWNRLVDAIREARDGHFPEDWGARVVQARLLQHVRKRWAIRCGRTREDPVV
jgi:hypothetical protein